MQKKKKEKVLSALGGEGPGGRGEKVPRISKIQCIVSGRILYRVQSA